MFQHKLNEIEKQIIEKEVEDDKVDEEDKEREKERERENEREKVLKQLSLRDQQFYTDKFELDLWDAAKCFKGNFPTTSGRYWILRQFNYGLPICATNHIRTCIELYKAVDEYEFNIERQQYPRFEEYIYIGEVKKGTDHIPHGIGIKVLADGRIEEGYWKNGKLHGRGRRIYCDGYYYIGEFKGGYKNGEGTEYYNNGDKYYEGGWKNGEKYGQGTLYEYNGDKYTGIWDGDKGQGEINYNSGYKYIGQWDGDYCSYKHGLGTLYSADGQVLNQGKWDKDEYMGKE